MSVYDTMFWQKWYEEGIPESFNYSKVPLKNQFSEWVSKHPDKTYIYFQDTELSYEFVDDSAKRLASSSLE